MLFRSAKLKPKQREYLEAALAHLPRSRSLVTVVRDLDLDVTDFAASTFVATPSDDAQHDFFTRLGFASLAPEKTLDEMEMA